MKQEGLIDSMLFSSQGVSVSQIFILLLLGLLPVAMMSMTSYLKVSIILAVLRNALGGGQVPSQAISGVLALVITFFTMAPVFESCLDSFSKESTQTGKDSSFRITMEQVQNGAEPLLQFLRLNTGIEDRLYFARLDEKRSRQNRAATESKAGNDSDPDLSGQSVSCLYSEITDPHSCLETDERTSSLILSFVMSELRTAFTMAVYLFLPFLVIDLIISTVLTGLGMMMVSPVTISLPVKLLLFVVTDGWRILTESLILGYVIPV